MNWKFEDARPIWMQLTERLEFPGSSHDVITQEVYSK